MDIHLSNSSSTMLHIFTDGACSANGQKAAKAAYAVVFWNLPGREEPLGLSSPLLPTEPQTNQRAELRALQRAFIEIQERSLKGPITIWTDSDYSKKCVTEWGPQWKARGWRRANQPKKPIEHLDILQPMINFYEESQHFVRIQHIAAHTNKKEFPYCGNALADKLATEFLTNNSNKEVET